MTCPSEVQLETFTIDVHFFSGAHHYATQRYSVSAANWYIAQREAIERSLESPYDNSRIPDLTRRAQAI